MDIRLYLLFGIALFQTTLCGFMLFAGKKKLTNYLCSAWIMTTALWTFGMMMHMQDPAAHVSIFLWTRILYFAGFLSSVAFFLFALNYTNKKISKYIIALSITATAVMAVFLFATNDIISGINFLPDYRIVIQEKMYGLYLSLFFSFYVLGFLLLFQAYRKNKGVIKKQLQYIFIGLLPPVCFSSIVNIILPTFKGDFTYAWMGPMSLFIMVSSLSYAISKHRFLDLELTLQNALSKLTVSLVFLLPLLPLPFLKGTYQLIFALMAGIYLTFCWIFRKNIFKSSAQLWNQIFYRRSKNPLDLIKEAQVQFTFSIQNALELLKKAFQVKGASFVYSTDAVNFELLAGKKGFYISSQNNLIQKLQAEPTELIKEEIEYFLTEEEHPEKSSLEKIKQEMDALLISAAFPVIEETQPGKRRLVGVLFLSEKIEGGAFSTQLLKETKIMLKEMTLYLSAASTKEQIEKRLQDEKKVQQEFARGLLHEVNTPLVYSQNLSMILDWIKKDPQDKKYLHQAEEGVKKVTEMVAKVSEAISWQTEEIALQKVQMPLKKLLKTTLAEMKSVRRKNIIVKRSPYWETMINVDPHQMVKAFKEIIENAFFFTDSKRKPKLSISLDKKDDVLLLGFQDNGKGIDREHWNYIFAPLYVVAQSRNRAECGIGCGLTLVQGVLKAHGGKVYISDSKLQKGTLMVVEIPFPVQNN